MKDAAAITDLSGDPLAWIGAVLDWRIDRDERGSDPRGSVRYWAIPSKAGVRTLVPSVKGGGRALHAFNDSMSRLARLKKVAMGVYLGMGTTRLPWMEPIVFTMGKSDEGDTLIDRLSEVLGHGVVVGVACGRDLRPNRKPVLQILNESGEIVAFVKVGWNPHTRSLVDDEARALGWLADHDLRSFQVPKILHHGDWAGRRLLVLSAAPRPPFRRGRRNTPAPLSVELEIARSRWSGREEIGASRYLEELGSRLSRPGIDGGTADRVRAQIDLVMERRGGSMLEFGAWHGDFAAWNTIRTPGRLFVMDWERYAGPVPVGFDHLHHRFQALRGAGRSVAVAAEIAMKSLRTVASDSGNDPDLVGSVFRLYLLEPLLRDEEGRAAGMTTGATVVPALLEFLEGWDG
jgi:hypothetical protein